jgi:hypothetical protein
VLAIHEQKRKRSMATPFEPYKEDALCMRGAELRDAPWGRTGVMAPAVGVSAALA